MSGIDVSIVLVCFVFGFLVIVSSIFDEKKDKDTCGGKCKTCVGRHYKCDLKKSK